MGTIYLMTQPTQVLPEGYQAVETIDVKQDQRLLMILNVAGLVVLLLTGWLMFRWLVLVRAADLAGSIQVFTIRTPLVVIGLIAGILALTALHIILHEALHGVFFWLFTRSKPRFAFHWTYAYAAAPDWYIPRGPFLVTTLAPLVVITLAGLLIFRFAPLGWLAPTWLVVVMNAGGAVGDMLVTARLLRLPPSTLVNDRGDAVTFFTTRQGEPKQAFRKLS